MLSISDVSEIKYRLVEYNDIDLLYRWANDDLVRAQSFHSNSIAYKDHLRWFKKKIVSKSDLLFIAIINNTSGGLVRIEDVPNNSTIGVLLDEKFRGLGLSARVLIDTTNLYFLEYSAPITAYIKDSNVASKKSFEKAGFKFFNNAIINKSNSLVYKLSKS